MERRRELAARGTQGALDPFSVMTELLRATPLADLVGSPLSGNAFVPRFDVRETKDAYVFMADLPGLREEDVEVSLAGNTLAVGGRREEEDVQEGDHFHYAERSYGEFRRSFALPEGADPERTSAEFKNGVLRITVPKRQEVQSRRVQLGSQGSGAKA